MNRSEKQLQAIHVARELATAFAKNAALLDEEGRFSEAHYALAHDSGYMRLTLPEEHGGWGADPYTLCLAQEELAQGCAGTALAICMHLCVQANLSHSLSETQKRDILGECSSKPVTFAGGGTEAGSGGSWQQLRGSAARVAGGYLLNGRKKFASGARVADYFLTFMGLRGESDDEPAGTMAFVVPRRSSGLRVDQTWNSMGMRASGSDDVVFENVQLSEGAVVGRPEFGFQYAARWMYYFAFGEAATYVGVAVAALKFATAHVQERHRRYENSPLAPSFDSQLSIGEMLSRLECARAFLHQEAQVFSSPEARAKGYCPKSLARVAMAKYACTTASMWVCDRAMDLVGGFGFLKDSPLERHYRDVRGGPFHPPRNCPTAMAIAGYHQLGIELDSARRGVQAASQKNPT